MKKRETNIFASIEKSNMQKEAEIIDFIDLGAGPGMERALAVAGKHRRQRKVVAVDVLPANTREKTVEYIQADAADYLRRFVKDGKKAKVINADHLFAIHALNLLPIKPALEEERINEVTRMPIHPELLQLIKSALAENGRLYVTTTKWHCEPLAEKLKETGFNVRFRPITDVEAAAAPGETTQQYQKLRKKGQITEFNQERWQLQRLAATKRDQ